MFVRRHRALTRVGLIVVTIAVVGTAIVGVATAPPSGNRHKAGGGVTHGRIREWEAAVDTWLDRPLIGAGSSAYYAASVRHQGASPTPFAHNLVLELAAELGVLGLALGLGLYGATLWTLVRARATPVLWLLGPGVAAFLIANLVDWSWHLAGLTATWAVAAGALQVYPLTPRRR